MSTEDVCAHDTPQLGGEDEQCLTALHTEYKQGEDSNHDDDGREEGERTEQGSEVTKSERPRSLLSRLLQKCIRAAEYLSYNHPDPEEQVLTGVISFFLGIAQGAALTVMGGRWYLGEKLVPNAACSLALFVASTVVPFHFGEFYVATKYRPDVDRGVKAFMLIHSPAHFAAYAFAYLEFFAGVFLVPDKYKPYKMNAKVMTIAAGASLAFYSVRLIAMAQCGPSFSLVLEGFEGDEKRPEHTLVTHGIYRFIRHPSYFGWFWRASICNIILYNPISTVAFTITSWYFMKNRIPLEERLLMREDFFGKDYAAYRRRTFFSGVPFVR